MREFGGHRAPEVCVHMCDTRIGRQSLVAKSVSKLLGFSPKPPEFIRRWKPFSIPEFSNESCKHQGENHTKFSGFGRLTTFQAYFSDLLSSKKRK